MPEGPEIRRAADELTAAIAGEDCPVTTVAQISSRVATELNIEILE